uniref:Uncharacterized protein n=1 Tax=Cercocebus atys TaxID=9531 RepID=A0A2K5NE22_CERAT
VCMPVRVIVCVMGAVGAVWTHPPERGGSAFPFCRVCVLRPHRGKWRSWDVNLGSQGRGLLGCGPYRSGEPRVHLYRTHCRGGGLLTWGSMSGCLFLGLSAAECSLLLRPPSQGDLPVLVTRPVHHQQLAGVSGWLGTSLPEATCLGPHGGSRWGHHPGSRE